MDRQLNSMIELFQNLPVHTMICDAGYHVLWISEAASYTCPILVRTGDCLKDVLVGQELFFNRCEEELKTKNRMRELVSFYGMSFEIEATKFQGETGADYTIWHFLLKQESRKLKISSKQMLELGAAYRDSLFNIYNTVMPLMQTLDRVGCTQELSYLNIITENCQNMLKTTINVNEFLKLNNGSQVYQPEVFSLKQELKDLIEQVNFLLKSVDKYVDLKVQQGDYLVRLDWYKLMLVLLNLIANAIEHTVRGGEIELLLSETDRFVVLTLRDYGDGMRDAVKQSAFDPFFSYNPDNGMPNGIGLGLYLVKELVEAQGGTILLTSSLHEGTVVTLQFPKEIEAPKDTTVRSTEHIGWIADKMSPLYAFLSKHCDLHFY